MPPKNGKSEVSMDDAEDEDDGDADEDDEDDDERRLWICEFCGKKNYIDIEDEEMPKVSEREH